MRVCFNKNTNKQTIKKKIGSPNQEIPYKAQIKFCICGSFYHTTQVPHTLQWINPLCSCDGGNIILFIILTGNHKDCKAQVFQYIQWILRGWFSDCSVLGLASRNTALFAVPLCTELSSWAYQRSFLSPWTMNHNLKTLQNHKMKEVGRDLQDHLDQPSNQHFQNHP